MRVVLKAGVGSPSVDHDVSSAARALGPAVRYLAGGLAAVILIAIGTAMNLWFLPFIAGLAAGFAARHSRLRILLPVTATVGAAGWAVPLAWQAAHGQPIMATAQAVAALAGLPASGALVVGVTLVVAAIQAITGLWLARAIAP